MSAVERSAGLWLDHAVGHHVEGDLDASEASILTAKIKSYVGVTWVLLSEAHARRADRALGYETWADYVRAEFDMSRAHAYRLVAHAKAVYELAEAAGISDVSPMGDISERDTRDADLDEVAAEIERQTAALPEDATDEDRAEVVRQSLAKQTRKTTTTETTETVFDSETGEILSPIGDTATSGSDQVEGDSPAAAGSGDDEQAQDTATPSAAPKVAPDPALRLMADLSALRAAVAKWLAFDRHEQVIDGMTPEQRADYRSFVLSVFNHASATIDHLDAPARLQAVQ